MADFKFGPSDQFEALTNRIVKQGEMITHPYIRLQNALKAIEGGAWTGEGAEAFISGAHDLLYRLKELGLGFNELHDRFQSAGEIAGQNMNDIDAVIDE